MHLVDSQLAIVWTSRRGGPRRGKSFRKITLPGAYFPWEETIKFRSRKTKHDVIAFVVPQKLSAQPASSSSGVLPDIDKC